VGPLPSLVREETKYRYGLAALFLFLAIYALTNSLNWRSPQPLPPGWLDEAIPLWPATVWVYSSYLLIFVSAYVIEKDGGQLNRFLYAELATNIASALFFVFWPTTFARPELSGSGVSVEALELIWLIDEPVNCFPSLHVSSSILPALMLWKNHRRVSVGFLLWALAISLSTMTTKQHHSADLIGGAVLAAFMYWLFFLRANYREPAAAKTAESP
jgi:membrane-associated phospholipid phosphatase